MAVQPPVKNFHGERCGALSFLSSRSATQHAGAPNRSRFRSVVSLAPARRFAVVALAAKRSPKRLKYATPRFAKEGGLLYVEVDPLGGDSWKLDPVVDLLREGAVGVIPTDTTYAIVCDLKSHSAIERLRRIKDIAPSKPLSILCHSFHDIDTYTMGFPRGDGQGHMNIFRAVKHCLPGPYTFILTASKELPKQCTRYGTAAAKYAHRKSVGVRIPDDAICQAILERMDSPLISTRLNFLCLFMLCIMLWMASISIQIKKYPLLVIPLSSVKGPKDDEWMIDPVVIADSYGPEGLDFVVDGGIRVADPSTVVDMTGRYPKILRQGKGPKLPWMVAEDDDEAASSEKDLIAGAT